MKKLMFAAAIAASAAAFATPINAISFENSDYALIDNATNLTARADKPDPDGRDDNGTYFLYEAAQSGSSDSSFVTNAAAAFTDKVTGYFSGLQNYSNEKFLSLDTEGGTLWRSIGTLTGNSDALGTARAVAATGTYLDTLVQFTVTEDEAPTLGEDDKLAIWLQADEGTTNLLVKAAVVDDQTARTETTFTVTGTTVQPGIWYRLTVKAIADITDGELVPGFQIFLDGNLVTADKPTLTAEYLALLDTDSHYADLVAGKYFASLKTTTTLQGVGFQGTGAVDEIVWTDDDLFPAASSAVAFTLSWTVGQVSAVSYTIDGTETTIADLTSGTTTVDVAPGTVVTVAATAAPWYEVSAGTGDVTVADTMTQTITTALAATPADAGATGLPASITTANAKAWADAKNLTPAQIAACTFAEKAYLLNTDLTVEPTFAISAIEEVEDGWKITVEAKTGSTLVDLEEIRGTLKVKTGATLEALTSATSETIPTANLAFDEDGKAEITITGTGKNFIKAIVE